MKKNYITPSTKVIEFSAEDALMVDGMLSGSQEVSGYVGAKNDNDTDWDEEDF